MNRTRTTLLLVAATLLLFGCRLNPQLNPPSWVLGTWSDSSGMITWEFMPDDAVYSALGTSIDFADLTRGPGFRLSDSATSSSYSITCGSGGVSTTYSFTRISSTTIYFVLSGVYTLPLSKQDRDSVAQPAFSPPAGTYSSDQHVTITSATADSVIRYTSAAGGFAPQDPTSASEVYDSPIPVLGDGTTMIIKAIATKSEMGDSAIVGATYTINYSKVSTPQFNPGGGTYTDSLAVTINTTTSGASIYYTTDGSMPSGSAGIQYTGPLSVTVSETLRAIAYRSGLADSEVASATYVLRAATPSFSPGGGIHTNAPNVTITTATSGASIRYTTDNATTPTSTEGTFYSGPVDISTSLTLKAISYKDGLMDSQVASAAYTLQVVAPILSPDPGTYSNPRVATIETPTAGASIRYTTDGSDPTSTSGIPYSTAISVPTSTTIRAIAYLPGWADSPVTTAVYILQAEAPTFSPAAGTYTDEQSVAISTPTANASIRYTTDGSNPTSASGILYSAPFGVSRNQTVMAVSSKPDWADSPVATAEYHIGGVVTTFAGAFGYSGSTDGTGAGAQFFGPMGIATDGVDLYVADTVNATIRKIVTSTGQVSTLAGTPRALGSTDGTGASARFYGPRGITCDGTSLYVSDSHNNKVRKIEISTREVTTFASGLSDPRGITSDGINLYVAEFDGHVIRRIEIATGIASILAGSLGSPGHVDGTGSEARFGNPYGVTTDGTDVYVAEYGGVDIRKIVLSSGEVSTVAGGSSYGYADGVGGAARFNSPVGITSDGTNLYVVDANDGPGNNAVRQIAITTRCVTTLFGCEHGASGDGTGGLNDPVGIVAVDNDLYVADTQNHSIRKITK